MHGPVELSAAELAAIAEPGALLERAWGLEPMMRLSERTAALDRLEQLLDSGIELPATPGRAWRLELLAERAIDASARVELATGGELADEVLRRADPTHEVAIVRALMARGRVLAWTGTEAATRRADRTFVEVADRCRALAHREWLGFVLFWRGNTIFFQNGDLPRAAELMREALDVLGADSPRRSTVLTFYADVLTALGDWEIAERVLVEAHEVADRNDDANSVAYVTWSRARIASVRGDPLATERQLRDVERDHVDWFNTDTGVTFLADAAEMLDRVGVSEEAGRYMARAVARAPTNEFVRQAQATLLARSGDPIDALEALQQLVRGDWLEKRLMWRHTLLAAWATFRAGRRGAGELTARALEQADASAGLRVAQASEPLLVAALAPLAEQAGSAHARRLLLAGRPFLVRLFGAASITRADGSSIALPAGKPGELVRMLAVHERGLGVEVVLGEFFPDASPSRARGRLRQFLKRLRAAVGDLLIRDGDTLVLHPAWVDVREFLTAVEHIRTARGARAVQLAYAALALHRGPLLPADRYARWAEELRREVDYRHLGLLDLIAADAAARGSNQEALTALDAAIAADPTDENRYTAAAEQLLTLGRPGTARYLARLRGIELDDPDRP